MRRALCLLPAILPLLSVAACQQDFGSQYAETEKKIQAAEGKIDAQMAKEAKREPGAHVKSH